MDDIFNKRITLPGFKLGDSMLHFLGKFESLTQDQCDWQVEDLLDLVDDVELRLYKVEVMHKGMLTADQKYHSKINHTIGQQVCQTEREMAGLQLELEEQRTLKTLKADYEAISREIMAFEPQPVIRLKVAAIGVEITELEKRSRAEEIVRREVQMQNLLNMIAEIKKEVTMQQPAQ